MTKQEWLRLKPYAKIKSNPRGGWCNFSSKRAVKGNGKAVGLVLATSRISIQRIRYIK